MVEQIKGENDQNSSVDTNGLRKKNTKSHTSKHDQMNNVKI